jgi:hypothetical protein
MRRHGSRTGLNFTIESEFIFMGVSVSLLCFTVSSTVGTVSLSWVLEDKTLALLYFCEIAHVSLFYYVTNFKIFHELPDYNFYSH